MANNLVYSWADKLWQMNAPRNYIAARYLLFKLIHMRHIFLFTCIFTLMLSCSNTTEKHTESELNQEFKKYHIQQKDIEKGVVRITKVIGHDKENMKYSLFRKTSENRFIRENYNSDFVLVSKTHHKEKANGSEEVKTLVYQNNEQFTLNIIKPEYMTYSSNDKLFLSEYESGYLNVKTKCRYIGKLTIQFRGNNVECIIYERDIHRKYSRPGDEFEDITISRAYYGENLGVIYAEAISKKDTITQKVIDIISINEFEKLEKQ